MAKAPYKTKEEKKDKALHFRIPNEFYNQLKKLSKECDMGVNIVARKILTGVLYPVAKPMDVERIIKRSKLYDLEEEYTKLRSNLDEMEKDIIWLKEGK